MARVVMRFTNPTVKIADTKAGLPAAKSYECQITQALVAAQPSYQTIPATGCAGATQSPGATGYTFQIAWLQDWGAADSLSRYALDHDGDAKWIEVVPDKNDPTQPPATFESFVSAGSFGGTFGDGSAGVSSANWPLLNKPEIAPPTPAPAPTGATAGSPGSFTPSGAAPPADLTALQAASVTASPTTAWTTGQSVVTGDGIDAHWNGTTWATGKA